VDDGDHAEAEVPAPSSGSSPEPVPQAQPAPPERGWHPVPDNPNYQRFWDGQKWGEQRYWGGAGTTSPPMPPGIAGSIGPPGPGQTLRPGSLAVDPFSLDRTPSIDAPVQYQEGFFGAPLNPRSPARRAGVVALGVVLFFVYLSLHIFPTRLLVVFIVLGVVALCVQLPMRLRFLRDPARRAAIREPITFQSKVWLQFKYAPSRWPYFQFGRWDMAVRTDSFQVTNWVFGSRDRARSTFFSAVEARMWQKTVDGRDCIVVSGPTYNRSKVEFVFTADEGNAATWAALAAAGVRGVPMPVTDRVGTPTTRLTSAGPSTPIAPDSRRGFERVGSDLATIRTPHDQQTPSDLSAPAPGQPSQPGPPGQPAQPTPDDIATGLGSGRRRSHPIRAGQWTPAIIVGAVAFVLVAPLVLATIARVVFVPSPNNVTTSSVVTTQCAHEANSTGVTWSGTATRTIALANQGHVVVLIEAMTANGTELGGTRQELPVPASAAPGASGTVVIPLGPVAFMLPSPTSEQVTCQASFAYPNGIGGIG
jgi:hypothetical protein